MRISLQLSNAKIIQISLILWTTVYNSILLTPSVTILVAVAITSQSGSAYMGG